jgi:hypothetical protein
MLEWYGFSSDKEHSVMDGYIDCIAYRKDSHEPFMGIEVHILGNLDTDLKKLLSAAFLTNRVIITPDRNLIDKMSRSTPDILWFPPSSKDDHGFENFIRKLPGAITRDKYWHEGKNAYIAIETSDDPVAKFESFLRINGLNADLAETIIYRFASSAGGYPPDSEGYRDTNEFKFLESLGILQGLVVYWFDMEWGDNARYSYERAEVPNGTSTRKMKGEPLAYAQNKTIIKGVMSRHVENLKGTLGDKLNGYSKIFSEVALMGTRGYFRPYKNDFSSAYDFEPNWTPPIEAARLGALAANPFISSRIWEFGKELVRGNLGVELASDLVTAPYKLMVNAFGFSGSVKDKEEEVNEYLAWWTLYRGGLRGKNMARQCEILGVPFEKIIKCIDETFSMKLTSRYIPDTGVKSSINDFLASKEGYEIKGVGDISVFRPQEFESYCSKKIRGSLTNIF